MPAAYNPWAAPVFPTAADNAMQPETFVPQGVQDWTRQAAPKDYNILSQIAGSLGKALMYPGQVAQSQVPISTEDMVGPAFNLASMLTLGAGAAPQEANALNMGIKAYHGSPHDFDKFDLSKIGTGEGAQAYGHGLYFAESPGVAQSYRDALAGRQLDWASPEAAAKYDPGTLAALEKDLRGKTPDEVMALNKQYSDHAKETGRRTIMADMYDALKNGDLNKGKMYEVNINADPSHFLDWDKPLYQQPAAYDKIKAHADQIRAMGLQDVYKPFLDAAEMRGMPGSDFVNIAQKGGREALTADLKDAGIPGIKYLDQGSRRAGQGSSNYVVFNHDLIDIMRKYAVPGMLGAPILANALSEQKT